MINKAYKFKKSSLRLLAIIGLYGTRSLIVIYVAGGPRSMKSKLYNQQNQQVGINVSNVSCWMKVVAFQLWLCY